LKSIEIATILSNTIELNQIAETSDHCRICRIWVWCKLGWIRLIRWIHWTRPCHVAARIVWLLTFI